MRLSPARIEKTLNFIEASVIPETHPAMAKIKGIWGDHTYFLDGNGLNIVEPVDGPDSGDAMGAVINIANWSDGTATSLTPHEPQATDVVVEFDGDGKDAMH